MLFSLLFLNTADGYSDDTELQRLNMQDAVALAIRNNEDILISSNNVLSSQQRIREAWADALPNIILNGLYTRNIKRPVFFFPDFETGEPTIYRIGSANAYLLTLTLDQPLWQAGKVSGGIKVANLFKKYSDAGYNAIKGNIILRVKSAYYQVLLNEEILAINKQSLEQQHANLVNTRKLFLQGQVSELDTLRAFVDYTNIQPFVIRMENSLQISENRLKDIIGLDLEVDIELQDALLFEGSNGISLAALHEEAIQNRPELRQLHFQSTMLRHNIGITRSEQLPKLYFSGSYQYTAQSDQYDFGLGFQNSMAAGLRLEIPIFNGFRTLAKVQQAKLDYHNSEYEIQKMTDQLKIDVKSIFLNILEAEKRIQVQQHAIKQAERALFMSERRYTEGVGTQLEIGDSLLALNIAKSNYVQAVFDHKVALAQLDKALGRF
jgi:outer membrane protein TolC